MAKITIFGLAGTGTSTAGKMLASKLNCAFVSTGGIFREQAKEAGVELYEYNQMAEKDPTIDQKLDARIAEIGRIHEGLVLESRLGWYFVPDSFKVKFVCDDVERFSRVARRDNLSTEDAEKVSKVRENSHAERFRKIYGIEDYSADEHFDLIINTTHIKAHDVVEKILENIPQ